MVLATNDKFKGKHTKEKKIHKEYDVNADASLLVNNSFGNVNIVTWNQNKTVIDVVITTNGNNEEKVLEKLNTITVDFAANGSAISAKTRFTKNKEKWNSWWGKSKNNVAAEINYTIKMPITNSLNVSNDYGTITIDKLEGQAMISCDYGQLIIGDLMAENNQLNFDHSSNSTIRYIKSGKINADYSGLTLDKAEEVQINSDHSKNQIGEVANLNYNNDYGAITVDKAGNVIGRGDHISHNFGILTGSLNINTDFGGVRVARVENTCRDITIRSEYAPIKLGLAEGYNFNFIANLNYTGFKGKEILIFTKKHESNSDMLYEGYYGSKNSGNTININANYGGITLRKL